MLAKTVRTALLSTGFAVAVLSAPAFAGDHDGFRDDDFRRDHDHRPAHSVPEIDAGSGLAAVAALFGAMALAWERRRA